MLTLQAMRGMLIGATTPPAVSFSEAPTEPAPRPGGQSAGSPSATAYRARAVAQDIALSIPAMRKGQNTLVGICSTFTLAGWEGTRQLPDTDPRVGWLRQPDPERTLQNLLSMTFRDGLWEDRCVWRMRRTITDQPTRFSRVHPSRISTTYDSTDPDTVTSWTLDGTLYTPTEFKRDHLVFDFAGLGGLRRFGWELLELYADLQAAAGNYARAPHPKAILRNHGAGLSDEEIDDLLAEWNNARAYSSVGYLEDEYDYDIQTGWSPEELQLVEQREHAALEVARLIGLPAFALDAKSGESMTYSTTVEKRRDLLEALRPWLTVVEQTLSMDDRSSVPKGVVLPLGIKARFQVDAYTRNDPKTLIETAVAARSGGVLTDAEIRATLPMATEENPDLPPRTGATQPAQPPAAPEESTA